jgi:hypothetical protein
LKVIVWSPFAMLNVRGTSGAGLKILFPAVHALKVGPERMATGILP